MAVTFRSKAQHIATVTGNSVITEPAGTASGDYLIALALCDFAGAITAPGSWVVKDSGSSFSSVFKWNLAIIARGASAPDLTWVITGTSIYREVHVIAVKPAAGSVVLDAVSASGANLQAANHPPDPPAVVAVATASLAIAAGINYLGSGTGGWTASSGYVIRSDNTAGNDGFLETKSLAASGSENPAAVANLNGTSQQDYWDGFAMTFTEGGGSAVTITSGLGAQTVHGLAMTLDFAIGMPSTP